MSLVLNILESIENDLDRLNRTIREGNKKDYLFYKGCFCWYLVKVVNQSEFYIKEIQEAAKVAPMKKKDMVGSEYKINEIEKRKPIEIIIIKSDLDPYFEIQSKNSDKEIEICLKCFFKEGYDNMDGRSVLEEEISSSSNYTDIVNKAVGIVDIHRSPEPLIELDENYNFISENQKVENKLEKLIDSTVDLNNDLKIKGDNSPLINILNEKIDNLRSSNILSEKEIMINTTRLRFGYENENETKLSGAENHENHMETINKFGLDNLFSYSEDYERQIKLYRNTTATVDIHFTPAGSDPGVYTYEYKYSTFTELNHIIHLPIDLITTISIIRDDIDSEAFMNIKIEKSAIKNIDEFTKVGDSLRLNIIEGAFYDVFESIMLSINKVELEHYNSINITEVRVIAAEDINGSYRPNVSGTVIRKAK